MWTSAEVWKLYRALKIYDRQIAIILSVEDFGEKVDGTIRRKATRIKAPEALPSGCAFSALKVEQDWEGVRDEVFAIFRRKAPQSKSVIPKCFLDADYYTQICEELEVDAEVLECEYTVDSLEAKRVMNRERQLAIVKFVKRNGPTPLHIVCDKFELLPKAVVADVEALKKDHVIIEISETHHVCVGNILPAVKQVDAKLIDISQVHAGDWFRFGAVGDTHIGSRWQRLDVLGAVYESFEKEGITEVFHAGNIVEGESRWNKYDIKVHGLEGQIHYCCKKYPNIGNIKTKFITGDCHEGWWIKQFNINFGKRLVQTFRDDYKREDIEFLGHLEADVGFKGKTGTTMMRVFHPGGGSAYATSYPAQKIVESYQGGDKPHILLLGHYHKVEYGYPRGVHVVQVGCCCDQSSFMRKLKLQAHVGAWIIEFQQGGAGEIVRFRQEFFPFYDKKFYQNAYHVPEG